MLKRETSARNRRSSLNQNGNIALRRNDSNEYYLRTLHSESSKFQSANENERNIRHYGQAKSSRKELFCKEHTPGALSPTTIENYEFERNNNYRRYPATDIIFTSKVKPRNCSSCFYNIGPGRMSFMKKLEEGPPINQLIYRTSPNVQFVRVNNISYLSPELRDKIIPRRNVFRGYVAENIFLHYKRKARRKNSTSNLFDCYLIVSDTHTNHSNLGQTNNSIYKKRKNIHLNTQRSSKRSLADTVQIKAHESNVPTLSSFEKTHEVFSRLVSPLIDQISLPDGLISPHLNILKRTKMLDSPSHLRNIEDASRTAHRVAGLHVVAVTPVALQVARAARAAIQHFMWKHIKIITGNIYLFCTFDILSLYTIYTIMSSVCFIIHRYAR